LMEVIQEVIKLGSCVNASITISVVSLQHHL
jgi:hypothetical protein